MLQSAVAVLPASRLGVTSPRSNAIIIMIMMTAETVVGFGAKYNHASSTTLASSQGRRWHGIHAEIRRHRFMDAPPFVQPVTEVVIVTGGHATVERRGDGVSQRFDARPGSFCICPLGVSVEYLRIRTEALELVHLYLPSTEPALSAWTYSGDLVDPLVCQIGEAIADEVRQQSVGGALLVDALRQALVARINHRHQPDAMRDRGERAPGLNAKRLSRVIEFIRTHIEADTSLAAIAEEACLSRHHFLRSFKHSTGTTPSQYLGALRVARAKQLLVDTADSIDSIAYRLQFSDSANFARAFRRQVGVSPSQFRQLERQRDDRKRVMRGLES